MYAHDTSVAPERTQGEIMETLRRYKASEYTTGWVENGALVQFRLKNVMVRIHCKMPNQADKEFTQSSRGRRTPQQAMKAWEQAVRSRWRALLLIIKAKLEAVTSGVSSFEEEFLAHVVTESGATVFQTLEPLLAAIPPGGHLKMLAPPRPEAKQP